MCGDVRRFCLIRLHSDDPNAGEAGCRGFYSVCIKITRVPTTELLNANLL